jgi:hypothetical protein
MDKIKSAYGYLKAGHDYATAWVAAHPVATVNAIIVAVVLKTVLVIL